MNPNFFVFCEGETEETYIKFLRSIYRLPIQIIPRKSDSNISIQYIQRCKKEYYQTNNDQTFLMFDLDIDEKKNLDERLLERLKKIPSTTLICSNPCIEFWFLLHYIDHKNTISTKDCMKRLLRSEPTYEKPNLTDTQKQHLQEHVATAFQRATKLRLYDNPSSSIFIFIDELEKVKNLNKKTRSCKPGQS